MNIKKKTKNVYITQEISPGLTVLIVFNCYKLYIKNKRKQFKKKIVCILNI